MTAKDERRASIRDLLAEEVLEQTALDSRLVNRKAAVLAAKDQQFILQLEETLSDVFCSAKITPGKYDGKKSRITKRFNNVLLTDLHFRSLIDPRECPLEYSSEQEARRFGKLAYELGEYKIRHRAQTELNVFIAGDIIEGVLHDERTGDPLAMQFAGALHYLVQFLLYQSTKYKKIHVYCTPGNHGRNKARHHDRAVHQKWDSIETTLYVALRYAMMHNKNIDFSIPMTPYITYKSFDKKGFVTHGDTNMNVGYPGTRIDVKKIQEKVNKYNTSRNMDGPYELFAIGHVHFNSKVTLPGNVTFVSNGCLVPPDPFSVSRDNTDVTCGQLVWESVPDYIFGDDRLIIVEDADSDKSWESIIKPFNQCL